MFHAPQRSPNMNRGVLVTFLLAMVLSLVSSQTERVTQLEDTINNLARQLMLQQLFVEERIRSDGNSGIKQIRHFSGGTRPYHAATHTLRAVSAIHDHTNNIRTLGMGEVVVVMNGVEFRTRHNDYKLYMPSRTSQNYHEVEEIEFPPVPQSVLDLSNVTEAAAELREYFKAWQDNDVNHRDFKDYFKPVLCYMEAAWTTDVTNLEEPFDSDRHHIAANNWFDLQEKIRFTSVTGLKNNLENYAFLPTTIMNVTNGELEFAQWNYRILCHPLKQYVHPSMLKVADDVSSRMAYMRTLEEHESTRAARFRVNWDDRDYEDERAYSYGLLDRMMAEIPGKNNYPGSIQDDAFGLLAYQFDAKDTPLNAAYYHRIFRLGVSGAMGTTKRHRGFSDEFLFVALNNHPKVSSVSARDCYMEGGANVCKTFTNRVSYAIPLELVFLTPLHKWNPYELIHQSHESIVTAGGRIGSTTDPTKAYNGTSKRIYYITPKELFQGSEVDIDPADTVQGVAGVLDQSEKIREVVASGIRIILPKMMDVGALRTRYPICPVHGEGRSVWKELDAMKEMFMNMQKYANLLETKPAFLSDSGALGSVAHLQIPEVGTMTVPHAHDIYVTTENLQRINDTVTVMAISSFVMNHQHTIEIAHDSTLNEYHVVECDGVATSGSTGCRDNHPLTLKVIDYGQ